MKTYIATTMEVGTLVVQYQPEGVEIARMDEDGNLITTTRLNSQECEAMRRFLTKRMRDMDEERNPR